MKKTAKKAAAARTAAKVPGRERLMNVLIAPHVSEKAARISETGNQFVFRVRNDATRVAVKHAVELMFEVKVDDGPWQPAVIDMQSATQKYAWKLFTYNWKGATPGEHTLVSRVTDITGRVQPTAEDLANKKTFLEDNSQAPRKITIA